MNGAPEGFSLLALSPFLSLGVAAVAALVATLLTRRGWCFALIGGAGAVATVATAAVVSSRTDRRATALLVIDDMSLYFIGLVALLAGVLALFSYGYLRSPRELQADYYVLLLVAVLGATVLVASRHFASLFLGLEVLSVSLYGLIAYPSRRGVAIEASLKYLILAASTSALLLFGIALVFTATGTLDLVALQAATRDLSQAARVLYVTGLVLVLAGIGFKLAFVPFHMWTADVYQGAMAPVTGLVASVSKVAVFVLLLRYASVLGMGADGGVRLVLDVMAYASMLGGNLLALLQTNVKRMLAYSSIGHLGFLLVGLLAGGGYASHAVGFYLSTYAIAIVAAFGVIGMISRDQREPEELASLRGLGRRRPWLGGMFAVALLSLAGLPVSAGFIGKFLLVQAGAETGRWGLVVVLVVSSAIGLFYYLRVLLAVFDRRPGEERRGGVQVGAAGDAGSEPTSRADGLSFGGLAVMTAVLVVLGVYPSLLLRLLPGA